MKAALLALLQKCGALLYAVEDAEEIPAEIRDQAHRLARDIETEIREDTQ